ncbi:class I SAM-dependent methyltransferase [Pseudoalteromonas sp. OOF1S-7]|uniref:class I SAM-dependent methyltransferase n=1 Tax=Pseudoalteromonas sp. OOF1S-7 TaxID=2917757 RepID=UPI001EF40472|nr:class I SAM-dependent methyltransferase [Pseudoalteromonas sp. OOF1S-7]MCG7535176.1 class I SAM-dependent methyltransferase [Pseudoalteromonas sp. OOF1S-7]
MIIHTPFAENRPHLERIEQQFALQSWQQANPNFRLTYDEAGLQLLKLDEPKLGGIRVDFVTGASAHRRKFGGGKGQAIAKAVGLNKGATPVVLDATAGLGRDAFVLAALGCEVILHERHPVVAALLFDGLERAYQDSEIGSWMQQNMRMIFGSSHDLLAQSELNPDVVYLDPMFPHREKSAQVKKEMRVFQSLVGGDADADALLPFAYALATKRVVVKRPDYAPFLNEQKPSMQIETKKNRFDVYVKAAMK